MTSCATKSQSLSYSEGYQLSGMEAAVFYGEKLSENETVELRYNYCYSLFEGEDYQNCLTEAKAAKSIYQNHIRFYYLEVLASEKLGIKDNYLEALQTTLELNPMDSEILHRLLTYYLEAGDKEKAEATAQTLLSINKKDEAAISYFALQSEFYQYLKSRDN